MNYGTHPMFRDATARAAGYKLLQCAAGFYRCRDEALQAMAELRHLHALPPDKAVLMAPRSTSRGSASWRAQQLSHRMASASGVASFNLAWAALAGGLCGGVLMTLWLAVSIAASGPGGLPLAWPAGVVVGGRRHRRGLRGHHGTVAGPHQAATSLRRTRAAPTRCGPLGCGRALGAGIAPGSSDVATVVGQRRLERGVTADAVPLGLLFAAEHALKRPARRAAAGRTLS